LNTLRRIFRFAVFLVVAYIVLLGVTVGIPAGLCHLRGGNAVPDTETKVDVDKGQMILRGTITDQLETKVREELSEPHDPIKVIQLSSIGGLEIPAYKIASELYKLGPVEVVTPSTYVCESACVLLAITPNFDFEPADSAKLMFHREWLTMGPDDCAACSVIAWELNTLQDKISGPQWHRSMFAWAQRLAPGLGVALAHCEPNPFDTRTGRTITGRQLKEFRAGQTDAIGCGT
jgi:hypothetical protein